MLGDLAASASTPPGAGQRGDLRVTVVVVVAELSHRPAPRFA